MLTKNELVTIIINSPSINATLNKIEPVHLRDDFRQHFYLQLLEVPEEKLLSEYNRCHTCLEQFSGSILKLQLKSNNSSFHKIYRLKTNENSLNHYFNNEAIPVDNLREQINRYNYDKVIEYVNHLHPKKAKIFHEYYRHNKSYKEIAKQYKIAYSVIWTWIKETTDLVRANVKYTSSDDFE